MPSWNKLWDHLDLIEYDKICYGKRLWMMESAVMVNISVEAFWDPLFCPGVCKNFKKSVLKGRLLHCKHIWLCIEITNLLVAWVPQATKNHAGSL